MMVQPSLRSGVGVSLPLCDERGLAVTNGCRHGTIGSASPRSRCAARQARCRSTRAMLSPLPRSFPERPVPTVDASKPRTPTSSCLRKRTPHSVHPAPPPRHACEGRHRTSAGTLAAKLARRAGAFVCLRQPSHFLLGGGR